MNKQELREEAAKYWDLENLYLALGQAKQNLNNSYKKEKLSPNDCDNLHGILLGKGSSEIANICGKTIGTTKNELTRLYNYIKKSLKYKLDEDIRNINITENLKKYKRQPTMVLTPESPVWWKIIIDLNNPDNKQLQNIVKNLSEIIGKPLTVQKIDEGSTMLIFETSQAEFKQIEEQFIQGQLAQSLGVTITDVAEVSPNALIIYWRQIYQNIFGANWQPVGLVLSSNRNSSVRSADIKTLDIVERAKSFDVGANQTVDMVIQLMPKDEEIEISIWLYPSENAVYLPVGLEVIILEESNFPVPNLQGIANREDQVIKLNFTAEIGETFRVKITLGNVSITENFIY